MRAGTCEDPAAKPSGARENGCVTVGAQYHAHAQSGIDRKAVGLGMIFWNIFWNIEGC